jgi:hypothetical protein
MPSKGSRRLIRIPIIHSQADLGSMSEPIRRLHVRRAGRARWDEYVRAVERLWDNIGAEMAHLGLDYPRTRLYQDGLPVCGREEEIVRDLAQAGSKNHQILLDLVGKGCRLTGTESPELLLQEYNLTRTLLAGAHAAPHRVPVRRPDPSQALLERRDRFMAERIAQTLEEGGTGLLFLGLLHAIEPHLPTDIGVSPLGPVAASRSG